MIFGRGEPRAHARSERGSALVLALVFLTVCGVTVGGLMTFANTSSMATTALRTARGSDYDAHAAIEAAIATVRAGATCGAGTTGFTPAWPLNVPIVIAVPPRAPLRVDCFPNSVQPVVPGQRNDVFLVCATPSSVSTPCTDSQSTLRANVIFFDTANPSNVWIQTWSNS